MSNRTAVLSLAAVVGLSAAARSHAAAPAARFPSAVADVADDEKGEKMKGHDAKEADDKDEDGPKEKKEKKVKQPVPMEMVPAAIADAAKREVPGGAVTEAELVAKKGKIYYVLDVKAGDVTYEVAVSVEGKFVSKKVDEEDSDDKGEKKADEKK